MTDINHLMPDQFMSFINNAPDTPQAVRDIYKSLHKFAQSDARAAWVKEREKCRKAALENEFFDEDEKREMRLHGQEPHVVNKLVQGIQGSSAIVTSNRPDIKVFPLRESDPYLAELAKSGLEHVWLKNYGNDVVYDMTEERNIGGIGAVTGRLDENKGPFGACVFEEDDAGIWYWDEDSKKRDRSDTHLIKAQLRSIQYILDNYPGLKKDDIVSVDDDFSKPTVIEDTKTGKDNYREGEKAHKPASDKKRRVWEIEAWMLRTEREHWAVVTINANPFVIRIKDAKNQKDALKVVEEFRTNGFPLTPGQPPVPVDDINYWPRTLNNRYLVIVVGTKVIRQKDPSADTPVNAMIEEVVNPLGLDSDGDPVLPVVFYYGQRTSKAYYRSPTFYAFDANKSLCKRESQYTLAVSKNLSAPVVREDSGTRWKDPKRPDRPGNELLISKSAREPTRLQPGLVDLAALTARIVEDKQNIDDAYNLSEVMRGKVPPGLERMSGRLGLALQDTGTIMHNPAIRGLESCLERLGKLLLAIILHSWPRAKWEALVTEERIQEFRPPQDEMNAEPDQNKGDELKAQEMAERQQKWAAAIDKITQDGISVVDFNIAITAGSSLPTNRLLKEETAIEKYKIGLYDRRAALEFSGEPHAKEVAARMDQREMQLAQAGVRVKKG